MSKLYALGVRARNRRFDHPGAIVRVPLPIISVGNITVGGTGKTPLVIDLLHRLERLGKSPAVVSRGYMASGDEPNDEELLIRRHCPAVVCVADPDRVRGARIAADRFGADVVLLDDGFQHRRLGRDLDIVAIDATCPFGFGHLLPRGLLREPLSSLRRADLVVLTRCDQASPAALARTEQQIRRIAVDVPVLQCNHRVTGVQRLDGTPWAASLAEIRAVLFAGIGHPEAFEASARACGVDVVGTQWWPDHHRYRLRDLDFLRKAGRFPPHDCLLTTEKDAVKLARLAPLPPAPIGVLTVTIDLVGPADTIIQQVLERVVGDSAPRGTTTLGRKERNA